MMAVSRTLALIAFGLICTAHGFQTSSSANIQEQIEVNRNNQTALNSIHAASWISSPSVRGTVDILWTCILTLVSCVFTVLHLNIKHSSVWNKLQWVAITLLSPEIILLVASRQFFEALSLRREFNVLLQNASFQGGSPLKTPYGLKACFFVVMGGVVVNIADVRPGPQVSREDHVDLPEYMPLSPTGILELAKMGCFIELDEAILQDRSKANILQKALVSTQVCWMAIQCIARKTLGLPITLLEIHVMVHVLFAVILYSFWFYKPLDVDLTECIRIESEEARNALAFMVQCQFCHIQNENAILYPPHQDDGQVIPSVIGDDNWGKLTPRSERCKTAIDADEKPIPVQWVDPTSDGVRISDGQALRCGVGYLHVGFIMGRESDRLREERDIFLTRTDITRCERVAAHLRSHRKELTEAPDIDPFWDATYSRCFAMGGNLRATLSVFQDRFNHSQEGGDLSSTKEVFRFIISAIGEELTWLNLVRIAVFPIVYGGVHLAAWDHDFPSRQEALLWKISCLCVVGFVPWVGLYFLFFASVARPLRAYTDGDVLLQQFGKAPFSVACRLSGICLLGLTVSLFAAAQFWGRVFIVVEAFVSLRRVPIGVYSMPSWIQMIPHV